MEFGELYEEYAKMIYRLIYAKCKNRALAEDIVQTTFLKAVQQSNSFREECKLSTWLCQIAKNEYLNYCRKHQREHSYDEYIAQKGEWTGSKEQYVHDNALEQIILKEEVAEVRQVLLGLDGTYREVIRLRIFGECSFKEIGNVFEKDATWARVTYYRAKRRIAEELKRKEWRDEL